MSALRQWIASSAFAFLAMTYCHKTRHREGQRPVAIHVFMRLRRWTAASFHLLRACGPRPSPCFGTIVASADVLRSFAATSRSDAEATKKVSFISPRHREGRRPVAIHREAEN
jgi:hypothetical protein